MIGTSLGYVSNSRTHQTMMVQKMTQLRNLGGMDEV